MINVIRKNWNWSGLNPESILEKNAFGNLIVKATDGTIWRIIPEDIICSQIASSNSDFSVLRQTEEFIEDWEMQNLVLVAQAEFGLLEKTECYCFIMPSIVGGAYDKSNFRKGELKEYLGATGAIGAQIAHLPDGTKVKLKVK